jgi:GNAT superfamily N-acetyltransferase
MKYVIVAISHGVEDREIPDDYAQPLIDNIRSYLSEEEKAYFLTAPINYSKRTQYRQMQMFRFCDEGLGKQKLRQMKYTMGGDLIMYQRTKSGSGFLADLHKQIDSDDFIHHAHFLTKSEGKAIGVRWVYFNPKEKCAYVPYGGVIPEYQHKGIYPKIVQTTESFLKENGVEVIFNECENPELITDLDARKTAQDRLNFFQKLGYVFVDPHVLPYMRPGWDYSSDKYKKEIDTNHYLFGFKPLANREKYITNEKDHPGISKDFLGKLHTDMIQLDNGVRDREALVKEFSAVNAYQKAIKEVPGQFVPLITTI